MVHCGAICFVLLWPFSLLLINEFWFFNHSEAKGPTSSRASEELHDEKVLQPSLFKSTFSALFCEGAQKWVTWWTHRSCRMASADESIIVEFVQIAWLCLNLDSRLCCSLHFASVRWQPKQEVLRPKWPKPSLESLESWHVPTCFPKKGWPKIRNICWGQSSSSILDVAPACAASYLECLKCVTVWST